MKKLILVIVLIGLFGFTSGQETAVENLEVAILLNERGEFEKSLLLCNAALDLNPEMSSAWFLRGFNNYNLENYKDAIVDFTVALNFNPNYAEAWFYRGKAKQQQGNLWDALGDLNKARELDSSKSAFLLVKSVFTSIFKGSDKQKKKAEEPESAE
jgi:tetratricopeptide (TPR) repeat protein